MSTIIEVDTMIIHEGVSEFKHKPKLLFITPVECANDRSAIVF